MKPQNTFGTKERLALQLKGFRKFNDWEKNHSQVLNPSEAIASIGYLYHLMPDEAKFRNTDSEGIVRLRNILRRLKTGN